MTAARALRRYRRRHLLELALVGLGAVGLVALIGGGMFLALLVRGGIGVG